MCLWNTALAHITRLNLILGIGLDDMFVMLSSWRRTSRKLLNEERMGEAFSDAAVSITITTLTDIVAIGFGAVS